MMKRYIIHDKAGNIYGELQCPPSQVAANTPADHTTVEVDINDGWIDQRRMKVIAGKLTRTEAPAIELDPDTARPLR